MRTAFINFLIQQASIDPNLYLIVDDTGFSVIEQFKEKFGERYINAGIAEQNMIGLAAGLAMAGKNVYVYGIIPFVTMRCFEQIRNDLCYQQLPVKIVGVGGGLSYATMGGTHHALEDVSIMRSLPHMTIVAPGSVHEAKQLMPSFNAVQGPAYLKCANVDELVTYPNESVITVGKAVPIVSHDNVMIIATGNALDLGWQVHKLLADQYGITTGLTSMPTIKPLDKDFLKSGSWNAIFTIEEQFITGGLGEAMARWLSENNTNPCTFHAFGIDDVYFHEAGSRSYLKESVGLKKEVITEKIVSKLATQYSSIVMKQPSS